ncbi:MAG: thioredoxin family protein [Gammaproteobacteria bacterium]|nr:thioredoxin family protein [Gammaproteobacteria bacterium]
MSRRFLTLLLPCLLWAGGVFADPPEHYPFVPFDAAMRAAHDEGRVLFVYFGRYGCGYCEKTNKEAFSDADVRARYAGHYALAYVDAESGKRLRLPSGERITERELGTRYDAFVTPVFTFLTPGGKVIHRLIGVQRIEDLVAADDQVQKGIARLAATP